MTGDQGAVAENNNLVDKAFRQHVAKAITCRNRIVVRAIENERQGRDFRRDFVASLERRGGKFSKGGHVGDEPLADRLLVPAGALALVGAATLREPGVERFNGRLMRNGRQKIGPRIFYQSFYFPLIWHDRA